MMTRNEYAGVIRSTSAKKKALGTVAAAFFAISALAGCGATAATGTTAAATTGAASSSTATTPAQQLASQIVSATTAATTTAATTAATTTTDAAAIADSNNTISAVNQVAPAVVTVYNQTKVAATTGRSGSNPFGNPNGSRGNSTPTPGTGSGGTSTDVTQSIGSGFIVSSDGYIVTNAHVVEGQDALAVVFADGVTTAPAKLIGTDVKGDIAVIKVDVKVPAVAHFGDSNTLQPGETVLTIGSALGDYRNSVTKGIVSGLNRTIPDDPNGNIYVQTDAPINHGNSGGPLIDLQGNVVAINTAVVRSTGSATGSASADVAEGLGFAIPSNNAKIIADQIIAKGSFARPFIGITFQEVTPVTNIENGTTGATGAQVQKVTAGSPAAKAGLQANDVISALNGKTLGNDYPLATALLQFKPGDTLTLTVRRAAQTLTLTLTLGTYPTQQS